MANNEHQTNDDIMNHDDHQDSVNNDTNDVNDNIIFESNRYYILIEFVYKHIDFHLAELQSVLEMNGIYIDIRSSTDDQNNTTYNSDNDMIRLERLPNYNIIHNYMSKHNNGNNNNNNNNKSQETDTNDNGTINEQEVIADDNTMDQLQNNNHNTTNSNNEFPSTTNKKKKIGIKKKNEGKSHRPFVVLSFRVPSPWIPSHYQKENDNLVVNDNDSNNNNMIIKSEQNNVYDIATIILSRCVLVRSVIELWGMGTSYESCVKCCQHYTCQSNSSAHTDTSNNDNDDNHIIQKNNENSSIGTNIYKSHYKESWKMTVHTLGSKYTRNEQNDMRLYFSFLNLNGNVQMIDPINEYIIIREQLLDIVGSPIYPRHGHNKIIISKNDIIPPIAIYFGRILQPITRNQNIIPTTISSKKENNSGANNNDSTKVSASSKRNNKLYFNGISIDELSLKKRIYLGPTSMDNELSFIMTNFAHITSTSIVLDPFVGTGSILLSAALHGAYVIGTDIDLRVLRGNSNDQTIISNFQLYNLPRPELIRSDNSIYHRHFRCYNNNNTKNSQEPITLYDAIICDPPYGIRAGARQSGTRRSIVTPILDHNRYDHIAQTKPYEVSNVMSDLLDVAARTLELNGRLVYIIPSFHDNFIPSIDLPHHECLQMIHCCYQSLSTVDLGRRIVVMKKIKVYDPMKREQYLSNIWQTQTNQQNDNDIIIMSGADKCANIREKLMEAAKLKPNYEEKKLIRNHKRKRMKEERKRLQLKEKKNNGDKI